MSTAALNSLARDALNVLVDKEEQRIGSRMLAYSSVARAIGASSSWVRKFIAHSEEVKEPRITVFQNIRASYDNLCSRVEEENRVDELRLQLLKGGLDAIIEGFDPKALAEDQARVGKE